MKKNTISLWRIHLIIAGFAAAAAPGVLFAGPCVPTSASMLRPPTVAQISSEMVGDKLIVSGRVVGSDCRGLAGALVEIWSTASSRGASAATDGDGRFHITSLAPLRGKVHIRVSYNGQTLVTQRELLREAAPGDYVSQLPRNESARRNANRGLTVGFRDLS